MHSHSHDVQKRSKREAVQGADLHAIREFNRLLILNHVREHGPVARVMIAHRLGLSRTTVSSIIDSLLGEGIVHEGNFVNAAPQGGRRAILVHFAANAGRVIGVDIGRSHLTLIITNLEATIIAQQTFPFSVNEGAEKCMTQVLQSIRQFAQDVDLRWEHVVGIGVGIPGPLDRSCHRVSTAPHMPGWENIDLWELLHKEFSVPVWIDRDANMGAIGEYYGGAGKEHAELAYIKIGTGIGAGLLLNKRIYRGNSGSAGEVGHLTIQENGALCTCGSRGCLETVAAAPLIIADASYGYSLSQQKINTANEQHTPGDGDTPTLKHTIADVLAAANSGEEASRVALERAGEHIGVALAGLINIFNPSAIIIDGGIARPDEIFLTSLQRSAAATCLPSAWQGTSIIAGGLGDLSVAIGAAYAVINAIFETPTLHTMQRSGSSEIASA